MGADQPHSYGKGYEYQRTGNPTRAAYEQAVASAEHAKYAVAYASGMAATTACIHLLKTGDNIICIDDVYGGTQRYFRQCAAPTYGMTFTFLDLNDTAAFEAAITPATKMVWLETPTNPTLKVTDIEVVAEIAHKHGLTLVVDNTFCSPHLQRPLELGADISLTSTSKYVGGHSDHIGGILCVRDDGLHDRLRWLQNNLGGVPGPHSCYLALRGLKTLSVRMDRHCTNAMAVATLLEKSDMVEKVHYPGLPSHPQHEIALKNTKGRGFGGMITFWIKGGLAQARKFLETLSIITLAESLGAVESLAESPAIMTHASVPAEVRAELGISDTLIRLSIGIEDIKDLEADVTAALEAASRV
jgi:cystathionine gamma-lyase